MSSSGDDRSIHVGRDAIGNSLTTGDGNTVTATTHLALSPAATVDYKAELVALREALDRLQVPDRKRVNDALDDAASEAAKDSPNKGVVAEDLGRALKWAKGANDFAGQIVTLVPHVTALASWLGREGQQLLSWVGG